MADKVALELPLLLPSALDARDRCVERLTATLDDARGIEQVHVVPAVDGEPDMLCLHFDPERLSLARVREYATAAGGELTERYGHLLWKVDGITGQRRARAVGDAVRRLEGVIEADVSVNGHVRVELDREVIGDAAVLDALTDLGVRRLSADPAEFALEAPSDSAEQDAEEHGDGGPFGHGSELAFAISSGVLLTVGFLLAWLTDVASVVPLTLYGLSFFAGGFHTTREAVVSVRAGRFEVDFLMLVAALGALSLGEVAEGALLLFLFSIGHALESYAMGRARRAIEALADLAPTTAIVRRDGVELEVAVAELAVGDTVLVRPGERVPADGFVVEGTSSVNQAPLTGESVPVDKHPVKDLSAAASAPDEVDGSSRVFAGTINESGLLEVQVSRLSDETALSKVVKLVAEAETQTSPTQRFTDRFERIFVPSVLTLVVALLAIGPVVLDEPFSATFYRAMAVLVAASPCALAIATPSAVLAGVARAGRGGVLVKGGGPLESLGRAGAIAFDKTGTLTEGRPRVTNVVTADGIDETELWRVAIAVERRTDHPLAQAVVRDGAERVADADVPPASDVVNLPGRGIRAEVEGQVAHIGSRTLFQDEEGPLPADLDGQVTGLLEEGRTVMVVRHGDRWLGALGLMDAPRESARPAIERLRELGLRRLVMLSGDSQLVATAVGDAVGMDEAWGDLMPDQKVEAINELLDQEQEVAMVGDGINDAPALAHASVGIAMGAAGSDVALETADIALMADSLTTLPLAAGLSRRASAIVRQNLWASLGIVAFLIPTTLIGFVGIGPAVAVHEGSTLIVVANALRLLAYRDPGA